MEFFCAKGLSWLSAWIDAFDETFPAPQYLFHCGVFMQNFAFVNINPNPHQITKVQSNDDDLSHVSVLGITCAINRVMLSNV